MSVRRYGIRNCVSEWAYYSGKPYRDPFNELELDVIFTDPAGGSWRVPAYWAGDQEWRVRFSPRLTGTYTYRTACTDESNPDLHGQEGALEVAPYTGANPLFRHGPVRVAADQRHLEHLDGTPFFWLGDIWWLGLTKRLSWPEGFQELTADRVGKGFNVIQLTAGLNCDMPAWDPRGENETGHPWEAEYARIRPQFFDMADLRIQWLVHQGLVPCLYGAWGFYILTMGLAKMKQHWRYLIARYGAYPVIWSLAGSTTMPYYMSTNREAEQPIVLQGWIEMAHYVHQIDPYDHIVVTHGLGWGGQADDELEGQMDCHYFHSGMGGREGFPRRIATVQRMLDRPERKPVVMGEGQFEGLGEDNREELQRMNFYAYTLLGLRGLTYGANGIWQFNNAGDPFGPSPWGIITGTMLWRDAAKLPGSRQVGVGKRLFERYPWWQFEYHPEWVEPHATTEEPFQPYAGGIPGQVRLIYMARPVGHWRRQPAYIKGLEAGVTYRAFYFDPKEGGEYPLSDVTGGEDWPIPMAPIAQDWVLVLERR